MVGLRVVEASGFNSVLSFMADLVVQDGTDYMTRFIRDQCAQGVKTSGAELGEPEGIDLVGGMIVDR